MNKLIVAVLSAAAIISSTAQANAGCANGNCGTKAAPMRKQHMTTAPATKSMRHVRCGVCHRSMDKTHKHHCKCEQVMCKVTKEVPAAKHKEKSCDVMCPAGSKEVSRKPAKCASDCDEVVCETMVPKCVRPIKTETTIVTPMCHANHAPMAPRKNVRQSR